MKTFRIVILILLVGFITSSAFAQQWTASLAKKWVKNRESANGSKIKLSSSADEVEFARQYHANKAWWDKAFAFLNDPTRG